MERGISKLVTAGHIEDSHIKAAIDLANTRLPEVLDAAGAADPFYLSHYFDRPGDKVDGRYVADRVRSFDKPIMVKLNKTKAHGLAPLGCSSPATQRESA
jgi:hypothetical protein